MGCRIQSLGAPVKLWDMEMVPPKNKNGDNLYSLISFDIFIF
jgi:hypothetical protein